MASYTNLPAPSPEQGLNRYLQEIRKFPMLEPEEEYMLAKRWVDHQDASAAHRLVTSHLRLAAKIAELVLGGLGAVPDPLTEELRTRHGLLPARGGLSIVSGRQNIRVVVGSAIFTIAIGAC